MNNLSQEDYNNLSALKKLELWINMPLSKVKDFIEMDNMPNKYPDLFISEKEQALN